MKQVLGPLQKMYLILCLAEGMRDECAGKEELKADYQICSRIYANAFASMIRYGTQPNCESRDGVAFLTVSLEGHTYSCPARTVKNIMKAEFASVEEKLPVLADMVREEEAKAAAEMKAGRKRKKQAEPVPVPSPVRPAARAAVPKPETASSTMQAAPQEDEGKGNLGAAKVFRPQEQKVAASVPDGRPSQPVPDYVGEQASEPAKGIADSPDVSAVQDPVPDAAGEEPHRSADTGNGEALSDPAPGPLPPMLEGDEERPATAEPGAVEAGGDKLPAHIKEEPTAHGGNADVWTPVPRHIGDRISMTAGGEQMSSELIGQHPGTPQDGGATSHSDGGDTGSLHKESSVTHAFQKKQPPQEVDEDRGESLQDDMAGSQPAQPGKYAEPAGKTPLGVLSRFLPKGKKQDMMGSVPAPQPIQDEGEVGPDEIPHVEEEGHGERICHTHYVMLRKTYGTQVTGPYVIQVWPTEVIKMCPDRMPSAIFVRAQAPNGTVICKVNEGRTKYIVLDIDNKQFNVFGYWESGKFITEVSAINKTASIYTMSEELEQECPEDVADAFLDQFRSRELHRPEFFVVPVSSTIPESGTVPIAAFIRVKDKNYPVTSRGPGDTLRFTYEGQLSEISGWWEEGRFAFAVRVVEEE